MPRRLIATLVIAAVMLPTVICVLLGLARLLAAMNDLAGAAALDRVALGCGVLWVLTLIGLVVVQAFASLTEDRDAEDQ